jgi:TIR domain
MKNVFISYSHRDKELATLVAKKLHAEAVPVWFDDWEIRPGDDIEAAINTGLDSSEAFVILVGAESNNGSWLRIEMALAMSKGKRIVPILTEKNAKPPFLLRHVSYLDLSDDQDREFKIARLANSLKEPAQSTAEIVSGNTVRSSNIETSAKELKQEVLAYEMLKASRNQMFAHSNVLTLISVWLSIVALYLSSPNESASKYYYISIGVAVPLVIGILAKYIKRYLAIKSQQEFGVKHE